MFPFNGDDEDNYDETSDLVEKTNKSPIGRINRTTYSGSTIGNMMGEGELNSSNEKMFQQYGQSNEKSRSNTRKTVKSPGETAKQDYAKLMAEYQTEIADQSPSKRRNGTTAANYKRSKYDPNDPTRRGNRRTSTIGKGVLKDLEEM